MTLASLLVSSEEGGTPGRSRSAAVPRPGDAARAERYAPPTAAEVGRAAALCFQDSLTDEQIARQVGIVRRTLARWKKRSDFAAALAALQAWQEVERTATAAAGAQTALATGQGPDAGGPASVPDP